MGLLRKKSFKIEIKITQNTIILNDFENRFLVDFLPQGNPKKTKQENYGIASQEICRKSLLKSIKNWNTETGRCRIRFFQDFYTKCISQ